MNRLLLIAFLLLTVSAACAETDTTAVLFSIEGTVEIRKVASPDWVAQSAPGGILHAGDLVRTGRNGRAAIRIENSALVRLAPETVLVVQPVSGGTSEGSYPVELDRGRAHFYSRDPLAAPVVETPFVTAAVRGTEFAVEVGADSAQVFVLDGVVSCSNTFGSVDVGHGEQARAERGRAPEKRLLVDSESAVQWTFHLPPLGATDSLRGTAAGDLVIQADVAARAGSIEESGKLLDAAFARAGEAPSEGRSAILSAIGARRAILATVRNDSSTATREIENARENSPGSADALLAESVVSQSSGDLAGSLRAVEAAIAAAPGSAYAHARLAELLLGFGETESARTETERALALDGASPYAITVRGFIELIDDDVEAAKKSFGEASEVDQGAALAHLGMGLALIREGSRDAGRAELEKAALLEPSQAIFRSYLGKAYFEDERERTAAREFGRAMELDPRDPTPYLYRALNQLALNRPVGALRDLETSTQLNGNRAVYRSRLLLDQDLGVRSAGLAEAFNAAGFQDVARIESIKALGKDYGNFSAHRLLADSYFATLFDDAKITERTVSTLLAPLSFNLLRANASSGVSSINDYSALFERDQFRTTTELTYDTQLDTFLQQVFVTGRSGEFGYYLREAGAEGNGTRFSRANHDRELNGALQYQPESRMRFLLEGNALYSRIEDEVTTDSAGPTKFEGFDASASVLRKLGPASRIIGQFAYAKNRSRLRQLIRPVAGEEAPAVLESTSGGETTAEDLIANFDQFSRDKLTESRTSLQYSSESRYLNVVSGAEGSLFRVSHFGDDRITVDALGESGRPVFTATDRSFVTRANNSLYNYDLYLYPTVHPTGWLDVTAGISRSGVESDLRNSPPYLESTGSTSRWNPKLGATVELGTATFVRAAYFESLRKSASQDLASLQPTLVGGINQIYVDPPRASARNYGLGLDSKVRGSAYFGAEYLHRDIVSDDPRSARFLQTIDFDELSESTSVLEGVGTKTFTDVDIVKSYYNQVFTEDLVGNLEYLYARLDDTDPSFGAQRESNRLRFTTRYFDSGGWFAFLRGSFRDQRSELNGSVESSGDHFWTADAGAGYRLPHRHGVLQLQFLNLFDRQFTYDQRDGVEDELVLPRFGVIATAVVNF